MTKSLINISHTKQFILEKIQSLRPGWGANRVSKGALDLINAKVRILITRMVESHPTKGKTFFGE